MLSTYRSDCSGITEQYPQLESRERADPGHGEETNPFDTKGCSQRNACRSQPEPPRALEGVRWSQFLLVREAAERQGCQSSEENQRRVQEDQA